MVVKITTIVNIIWVLVFGLIKHIMLSIDVCELSLITVLLAFNLQRTYVLALTSTNIEILERNGKFFSDNHQIN